MQFLDMIKTIENSNQKVNVDVQKTVNTLTRDTIFDPQVYNRFVNSRTPEDYYKFTAGQTGSDFAGLLVTRSGENQAKQNLNSFPSLLNPLSWDNNKN